MPKSTRITLWRKPASSFLAPSEEAELPVLLDQPSPRMKTYARERVIAKKFEAMVLLGLANSRYKDFYDIWVLSRAYEFNDDRLARAIRATFDRRKSEIPELPLDALTSAFGADPQKRRQWAIFVEDLGFPDIKLDQVLADLQAFLMPHAIKARDIL